MEKIGIIGCRIRDDSISYQKVEDVFKSIFQEGDIIISGGCPKGGDRFAEVIAAKFSISIKIFKPNWELGRHAGFLRNTDIAKNSTVLIACVAPDRLGGTEDTIKKFKKLHSKPKIILC